MPSPSTTSSLWKGGRRDGIQFSQSFPLWFTSFGPALAGADVRCTGCFWCSGVSLRSLIRRPFNQNVMEFGTCFLSCILRGPGWSIRATALATFLAGILRFAWCSPATESIRSADQQLGILPKEKRSCDRSWVTSPNFGRARGRPVAVQFWIRS